MFIVVGAVLAAILIFALFRVLTASRPPAMGPTDPYMQPAPGPVFVQEPNPIAEIATVVAAEVIVDTAMGALFDSGPADFDGGPDAGFDPGFGDGF